MAEPKRKVSAGSGMMKFRVTESSNNNFLTSTAKIPPNPVPDPNNDNGNSGGGLVSERMAQIVNGLSVSAAEGFGRKRRRRSLVEQTGHESRVNELDAKFPDNASLSRRRNSVGSAYKGYEDFGELSFGTSADFADVGRSQWQAVQHSLFPDRSTFQ